MQKKVGRTLFTDDHNPTPTEAILPPDLFYISNNHNMIEELR